MSAPPAGLTGEHVAFLAASRNNLETLRRYGLRASLDPNELLGASCVVVPSSMLFDRSGRAKARALHDGGAVVRHALAPEIGEGLRVCLNGGGLTADALDEMAARFSLWTPKGAAEPASPGTARDTAPTTELPAPPGEPGASADPIPEPETAAAPADELAAEPQPAETASSVRVPAPEPAMSADQPASDAEGSPAAALLVAEDDARWAFGSGGFAKLYGDRLAQSSLLDRDVATRWVFVFMLSQADAEGRVRCASVVGLARAAAVTVEQAETAVRELEAPDPESTSKLHEGRRILRIVGGWQIVAYASYREYRTKRQVFEAAKKRRQRAARKTKRENKKAKRGDMSRDVPGTAHQTLDVRRQTSDRTEERNAAPAAPPPPRLPRSSKRTDNGAGKEPTPASSWPGRLAGLYTEILGGVVAPGRVGKALAPLVTKHGEAVVAGGWRRYLEDGRSSSAADRRFVTPADFARRFPDFAPEARPPGPAPEPAATGPIIGPSREEMEQARAEGRPWWK